MILVVECTQGTRLTKGVGDMTRYMRRWWATVRLHSARKRSDWLAADAEYHRREMAFASNGSSRRYHETHARHYEGLAAEASAACLRYAQLIEGDR